MAQDFSGTGGAFYDLLTTRPSIDYSVGLYSADDGEYYLIKIAAGTIEAARLRFSTSGDELHNAYNTNYVQKTTRSGQIGVAGDQISHEAYVLGQAETISNWVEIGTYTATIGAALAYGWVFNWDGTEAVCVGHEEVYVGGDLSHYVSRTYSVSITVDIEENILATMALEETATWEPILAETFIWIPNSQGLNQVEMWYPYSCGNPLPAIVAGYGESANRANVYIYYDYAGDRVPVQYFSTDTDTTTTREDLVSAAHEQLCSYYGWASDQLGVISGEYWGHLGKREFGFSVGGTDYVATKSTGGYYLKKVLTRSLDAECLANTTTAAISQAFLDVATNYSWPENDPNCATWPTGCRYEVLGHYLHLEQWLGDGGDVAGAGKAAFILPVNSSESAYVSIMEARNPELLHTIREGEVPGELRRLDRYSSYPTTPWVGILYPALPGSGSISDCNSTDISYFTGAGCWPVIPPTTLSETGDVPNYAMELSLCTAFERAMVETYETGDFNSIGGYWQLFYPSLCLELPTFATFFNMGSALGNSLRLESVKDITHNSNCAVDADLIQPYGGFWLGRV